MKVQTTIIVLLSVLLVSALLNHQRPTMVRTITHRDTVVVRDTVRDTVLIAAERRVVRTDTVWLRPADVPSQMMPSDFGRSGASGDSTRVEVPIERKTYHTENYRAVVEGFRPALVEMEVYRMTRLVTDTRIEQVIEKARPRWGIGAQVGYGLSLDGASDAVRPRPYIGIGLQWNLITF